jgi:exo-1,4-beta-D-glucosaminidase
MRPPLIDQDRTNVLAVEVFAPTDKDFGITFVDWNPTPPDKDMGLWREVYLTSSGPVRVRYPEVTTHFPEKSLERADLTVRTELHNDTDSSGRGSAPRRIRCGHLREESDTLVRERRALTF